MDCFGISVADHIVAILLDVIFNLIEQCLNAHDKVTKLEKSVADGKHQK